MTHIWNSPRHKSVGSLVEMSMRLAEPSIPTKVSYASLELRACLNLFFVVNSKSGLDTLSTSSETEESTDDLGLYRWRNVYIPAMPDHNGKRSPIFFRLISFLQSTASHHTHEHFDKSHTAIGPTYVIKHTIWTKSY
jgi:hypothetical protein